MKRTTLVFAVAMTLLLPVYAVNITNEVLVGTNGVPGGDALGLPFGQAAGPHYITGSTLTGGNAESITDPAWTERAHGGNGMSAPMLPALFVQGVAREIHINSTTMAGGSGGSVSIDGSLTKDADAAGGRGFTTARGWVSATNSVFRGGDGGSVTANGGAFDVDVGGGTGLWVTNGSLSASTIEAYGGNGGVADTSGASATSSAKGGDGAAIHLSTFANTIIDSTFEGGNGGTFNNVGGTASADGGAGLSVKYLEYFAGGGIPPQPAATGTVVIANSTMTGGNGGSVSGSASSTANGGAGLLLVNVYQADVSDSTFTGGSAGTVNGAAGSDGAGIEIRASTVNISGSELNGDLLFSGTNTSTISIQSTTVNGAVRQTGGTVNLDTWDNSVFQNTIVSSGTMNFNNQTFILQDGMNMTVDGTSAQINFSEGLQTEAGSIILTPYVAGTSTSYPITASGTGSIGLVDGTEWTIAPATNTIAVGQEINLAQVAGSGIITTNTFSVDNVKYSGVGAAGWLGGIQSISLSVDQKSLKAKYGQAPIDVALGVDGDTSTEFGKAMAELSKIMTPGSDGYNAVKDLANSAEEGGVLMTNAYVRTTEMASTLVGLQSMFADQVQDRIRSQLRNDEVGYPQPSSPSGAAGWDSMRTLSDEMESAISLDGMRSWGDRMEDSYGYDQIRNLENSAPQGGGESMSLPESWQVWGRGYGSHIEQDNITGFAGYDANVAGGMIGIDKSVNNLLWGFGGGYARTRLEGYESRDAVGDTGNAAAYIAMHGKRGYLDASACYAFNAVETTYNTMGYTGEFDAHTVGLFIGGGYGLAIMDRVLFTPEASILNTLYMRDSYNESSTLSGVPTLAYESYDQWSHLTQLGATLNSIQKINMDRWEMGIQPEVRVHWLHELNPEWDNETYVMGSTTIGATPMAREEDLVKVGVGLRLTSWADDTTQIGVDVDGIFGSEAYEAYVLSGKIMHRF